MKKQDISIESLVNMIERHELQLPAIQRRYVWRATRVRDLLDSLYRGYPSGSILVWETDEHIPSRQVQIDLEQARTEPSKLLLDGQQRLTSLAALVRGKAFTIRNRKRPIEILFNLDHPDGPPIEATEVESDVDSPLNDDDDASESGEDDGGENTVDLQARLEKRTFVVASRALAQRPNWVSVSEVFKTTGDRDILRRAGVTSLDDPRGEKYSQRVAKLRAIKNYMYVMHVLERDLSYEEVAEIFVRVNSLGMKLRSSDLALAQITARWPDSLASFEAFQEECEENWFTLDLGLLVRTAVVFATRQCKFQNVNSIKIDVIKASWEQAKEGLRFAINFLRSNAGIEDESLLSSPFLVIPIAVFSRLKENRLTAKESNDLLSWLHIANARGRFGRGSTETLLNEDLAVLYRHEPPETLIKTVERQFGRLHIEPGDLAGRGIRSPLFSLAYLALRAAGAKDWLTGVGISLTHQGRLHFVQHHHVFPRSLLKKDFAKEEVNEIANMAFISGQTNRRISNKEPVEYFPAIVASFGYEALRDQAIPQDNELHRLDRFRDFLAARRTLLAEVMNAFMVRARAGRSEAKD